MQSFLFLYKIAFFKLNILFSLIKLNYLIKLFLYIFSLRLIESNDDGTNLMI